MSGLLLNAVYSRVDPDSDVRFEVGLALGFLEVVAVVQGLSIARLCVPRDWSSPGSSVHGISQAKILEWVANLLLQGIFLTQRLNPCLLHWQAHSLPLSHMGNSFRRCAVCQVTAVVSDSATPWTGARPAPLSTGVSRQAYWSGLPCPPAGDPLHPGLEPASHVPCIGRRGLHH